MCWKSSALMRTRSTWSRAEQVAVRIPGGAFWRELGEVRHQADLAEVTARPDVGEHRARRPACFCDTLTKPIRTR